MFKSEDDHFSLELSFLPLEYQERYGFKTYSVCFPSAMPGLLAMAEAVLQHGGYGLEEQQLVQDLRETVTEMFAGGTAFTCSCAPDLSRDRAV